MMLYEEGAFELKDPVHRYIASFRHQRVYRSGSSQAPVTVPATEPVRIWHLLTHTSGLTYGFHYAHPVDAMYRAAGFEWGSPPELDLAGAVRRLGVDAAAVRAGHRVELLGVVRRARAAGRGGLGPAARPVLGRAHLRAAGHDRHRVLRARRRPGPPGRALRRRPEPDRGAPRRVGARRARRRPGCSRAAAGWCRARPTTTGSPRCCATAASSTGCACSARARSTTWPATTCPAAPTSSRRPAAVRRDHLRRRRLRARLLGRARPGGQQGAVQPGRVRLGWRGQHRLLGRPGRGPHRARSSPSCCRRAPIPSAPSSSSSSTRR